MCRFVRSPQTVCGLALISILALLVAGGPVLAQRPKLGNDEQIMVNRAISEGVKYLRARQQFQNDGSFPGPGHPVGVTALAGLALLESGLDKSDASLRAAGEFVRLRARDLNDTYDLSLAVLFLDRLGEKKDKGLIQMFALRLIGGQTTSGGWSYKCPVFNPRDQNELLRVLRKLEQLEKPAAQPGVAGGGKDKMPAIAAGGKDDEKGPSAGSASRDEALRLARMPRPGMCIKAADAIGASVAAAARPAGDGKEPAAQPPAAGQPAKPPVAKVVVTGELALLPVLQDRDKLGEPKVRGNPDAPLADLKGHTDNSNTQFAILAMWTAQRYEVPTRRTLELIVKRFRESQSPDGGWVYGYSKGGGGDSTPAMTCSGLAGLAVGFAMTDAKKADNKADEQLVKRAFRCLMKFVGDPSEKFDKRVPLVENNNLYYLWSIERVAVMYNLPTLGNRDWYRWGAEILITNQSQIGQHAGAWISGGNATLADPVVNTSFALLFLRGANLTSDLTDRLPINPEQMNRELAGDIAPALRTPAKLPGKNDSNPLGTAENRDSERPIDDILPATKPEATDSKPAAAQPVQEPATAPTTATEKKPEESNTAMIAIFAVVAVVVIAGVGAAIYFATRGGKKAEEEDDDKPRHAQKSRRAARDDEKAEEKSRPRRAPPNGRAAGKKPSRARYDDDDD